MSLRSAHARVATGAISAIAAGTLALSATPASAADSGSWRAYGNTNPITSSSSTWRCGSTKAIATDVGAQVCAIRSSGGGAVQGAVIVRNNRSSLYSVAAAMDLYNSSGKLGDWVCSSSGVGANSWSVCFGETISQSGSVDSVGIANGVSLGVSPKV